MANKIIGYFVYEGDLSAGNVLVLVDDGAEGKYTWFNPVRGETVVAHGFRNECQAITKADYIRATRGYSTPEKYL